MNAKKITSLVLAAMMAAGTSTTAFAALSEDRQLEILPNEPFYVEDDGVLVEDADQQVAPGTTIYIRLEEWTGADESTKDKNRFNVYTDWKVGEDSVEDVDIVYKKGDFFDANSNYSGYMYALDFETLNSLDGTLVYVAGNGNQTAAQVGAYLTDHPETIENLVEKYNKGEGYVVNNQFYSSADAAAQAAGFVHRVGGGHFVYAVDGDAYTNGDLVNYLTAVGFRPLETSDGQIYVDSNYSNGFGTSAVGTTSYWIPAGTDDVYIRPAGNGTYDYVITSANKVGSNSAITAINQVETFLDADKVEDFYYDNATQKAYLTAEDALATTTSVSKVNNYYDVAGHVFNTLDDAVKYVIADIEDATADEPTGSDDGYTYWIKIDTKEDKTTKLLDLAGTLTIGTSRSKAEKGETYSLDTTMSNRTTPYTVYDEIIIEANANGAVKFNSDAEDVVIYFGENEAAWYEFDARGQSALNFEWNMDFNREIADLFPNANIDFISWVAEPSTNRTGTLYITADADSYIYEVTEDGVKEVANAKYNEDEEAWEIRTRKLTAYAISDRELDTSITLDGEDNASSSNTSNNGGKDNPDTGR